MTMILNWLKKAWALWKQFGHFVGNAVGRLALTLLYFTVVMPFGLGVRLFSDPLALKGHSADSYWQHRPGLEVSLKEARRQ